MKIMNCLKCPNYWKTDIDETQCDKCGDPNTSAPNDKESEDRGNEQMC